jgi:hypothetical protein
MRAAMARLGDAMLARILPAAEAGACSTCVGQPCKCGSPCWVRHCTQYYFNCTCACVKSTNLC